MLGMDDVSFEPAEKSQTGVDSSTRSGGSRDGHPKAPTRFVAWVGRQSLPRLLGLLVGNTRSLEEALVKAEAEIHRQRVEYSLVIEEANTQMLRLTEESEREIAFLREEAKEREEKWSARFDALVDSFLLNKGMLPMTDGGKELVSGSGSNKAVEAHTTPKQMELEIEADKLLELLQRGDMKALDERIADLVESGRPSDKRILQLFAKREEELTLIEKASDIGNGVVIGPPEARAVS